MADNIEVQLLSYVLTGIFILQLNKTIGFSFLSNDYFKKQYQLEIAFGS